MPEPRSPNIVPQKQQYVSQLTLWAVLIFGAGVLAVGLSWIMVDFTVKLAGTFEIIAEIIGWIIWPFRI